MEHSAPPPLARWNPTRDCWETTHQDDLFSEHSDVWPETWPTSGMTLNGVAYELLTWELHTRGSASSSWGTLLPTTTAADALGSGLGSSATLTDVVVRNRRGDLLLPTPDAYSAERGGSQHPDKRRAGGHTVTLADSVEHLLPTPVVNDMGDGKTVEWWDHWTAEMKAKHSSGNGHGPSLAIEAQRLLPTPTASEDHYRLGGDSQQSKSLGAMAARGELLPTPSVADATGGHRNRSGARSDELLLPGLAAKLFPTPPTAGVHTSRRSDAGST